jgi:F-type H+-transporting ATPase subunit gamma
MATLRDIKRKIASINSTQTITKTMKMVSASKLRKAQEDLEKIRAYALKIEELTGRVIANVPSESHPLLAEREEIKNVLIVSIASDRGLCGGFNINIGSKAEKFVSQNREKYDNVCVYAIGKKIRDYLQRRKVSVIKDLTDVKKVDQSLVDQVASDLIKLYTEGEFDKIYLSYTHFLSPVKQSVIFEEFLPVKASDEAFESAEYLYEPEKDVIIDKLIPKYISTKIYFAILDSQTSEHGARMTAMENATNNSGEMINMLTLIYNKRRQESITNEMMDIVGGAEALRGK